MGTVCFVCVRNFALRHYRSVCEDGRRVADLTVLVSLATVIPGVLFHARRALAVHRVGQHLDTERIDRLDGGKKSCLTPYDSGLTGHGFADSFDDHSAASCLPVHRHPVTLLPPGTAPRSNSGLTPTVLGRPALMSQLSGTWRSEVRILSPRPVNLLFRELFIIFL